MVNYRALSVIPGVNMIIHAIIPPLHLVTNIISAIIKIA